MESTRFHLKLIFLLVSDVMDCISCETNKELVQTFIDRNHQLTLQIIDKDEIIRDLRAEVQTLGAKYRDMLWQRNALHSITLDEQRTVRYRQLSNE